MPEGEGLTKGIGGLLGKTTAGLPNWAWLLVIAGGIAAAVFLPKLFGGSSSTDTTSSDGSTTAPTDVLPPGVPIGGYGGGDGTGGGVGIMPPIMPPSPVGPPLPDCSLQHSCAQPPPDGKHCPPGMHLAKDGLCRCNAKGMVNWGTVCLPPGQVPPGYTTSTVTPPPTATTTAVAGQEASTATAESKLQEQNGLHIMPPIKEKGSPPPVHGKPIIKGDDDRDIMPPIKVTPRWPNKEDE